MSGTLTEIIFTLINLLLFAVPIAVSLALLFFFWGLAQLILNAAETDKIKDAKTRMIWGLITLFVILSLGGLVSLARATIFKNYAPSHTPLPTRPPSPMFLDIPFDNPRNPYQNP